MDLGEIIRTRRTELGLSQSALAKAVGIDPRQVRRYESGEQQPLFAVAAAIAAALGLPLDELAGNPAPDPAALGTPSRARHGIEFTARSDSDGQLRITGNDDTALLLWGAQWLDEHRDYIITGIRFQYPATPGYQSTTAIVILDLASPGTLPPEDMRPAWVRGRTASRRCGSRSRARSLARTARAGHRTAAFSFTRERKRINDHQISISQS